MTARSGTPSPTPRAWVDRLVEREVRFETLPDAVITTAIDDLGLQQQQLDVADTVADTGGADAATAAS